MFAFIWKEEIDRYLIWNYRQEKELPYTPLFHP